MSVLFDLIQVMNPLDKKVPSGWGVDTAKKYRVSEGYVAKMKSRWIKYVTEDTDDTFISAVYGGASGNCDQQHIIQG